jgi:hypothetical protein
MLFSFFWVFCTSLPNQIEHTCLKFQLQICKYEWARIIFVDGDLDSKLQHYGPYKNSWKKQKTSHSNCSDHIEGDVMQNHEQKQKVKKNEKKRFYGQNKLFFENPSLQSLGSFSHMAACRSSLENSWKMSLIPKGPRPFFGPFLKFGQAIVDAIFVQKISNFWWTCGLVLASRRTNFYEIPISNLGDMPQK